MPKAQGISLTLEQREKLARIAHLRGISRDALVRLIIDDFLFAQKVGEPHGIDELA